LETFIKLRALKKTDCSLISKAFQDQGWIKPLSLYLEYVEMQLNGSREIIIAEVKNEFAGYLTINWLSDYHFFREKNIPEIVDFNVLQKFQRQGIGTALMDEAEMHIKQKSTFAGIGFGMTKDYGAAQILYVKRGYIPDGNGLCCKGKPISYGEQFTMNDDLVLYLIKRLD
jgi:ribosomal protein S18 acetylase RimI-like enzyme